jgi:hypothetical protein
MTSGGYNVVQDDSCNPAASDVIATDAVLGSLADNGGPTQTMALLSGSPAIDLIPAGTNGCGTTVATDQRGYGRPAAAACDAGAFEFGAQPVLAFTGFFAPVDDPPFVNRVKAGAGVPVKFSLAGDQGLDIFASGSPTSRVIACETGVPQDGIEETVTAGGSSLTYDPAADTYTYVWKTGKTWRGTCRRLEMTLIDGTVHTADFHFTK